MSTHDPPVIRNAARMSRLSGRGFCPCPYEEIAPAALCDQKTFGENYDRKWAGAPWLNDDSDVITINRQYGSSNPLHGYHPRASGNQHSQAVPPAPPETNASRSKNSLLRMYHPFDCKTNE
jgi:hypothetical protein